MSEITEDGAGSDGPGSDGPGRVPRRKFLAGAVGAAAVGAFTVAGGVSTAGAATLPAATDPLAGLLFGWPGFSPLSGSLYIVAHQDDPLLFQSPQLLGDVQSNRAVTVVHLTAGDDGLGQDYWSLREQGAQAAFAQMAGVPNTWTTSKLPIGRRNIVMVTLAAQPNVKLVYMRLPDGGWPNGLGTPLYNNQSLLQMWQSTEATITAVDGSATYARQDIINTLAAIMVSYRPELIAAQDFVHAVGDVDHPDHHAGVYFAEAAHKLYSAPHVLVGYEGYGTSLLAANVGGTLMNAKQSAFYLYGSYDNKTCSSPNSCAATQYPAWLQCQYTVGSETVGTVALAGANQTVGSGATVQLDGSMSSSRSGRPLTYIWTQIGGPFVILSGQFTAKPSFTAPTGVSNVTFALLVSDGLSVSGIDEVTVSVTGGTSRDRNVALLATASASSAAPGQPASAAIDGNISGYPDNAAAEWATAGGGVGSWLQLTWSSAYVLDRVVLFDRPNPDDHITGGVLTFADGTTHTFGALPNDAATGLTVSFIPKSTTSVKMTVTSVDPTTQNVGLAEMQAWGYKL